MKKYLQKDSLIEMLTKYELYYEIGLANFIYETIQDIEESYKKLDELNLEVETDVALSNIIEVLLQFQRQEDILQLLDFNIRSRALIHALKDFANNDTELLNKTTYIEQKMKEIKADSYFNDSMKVQLESEYMDVVEKYEIIVTDEVIKTLIHNISAT